MSRRVALFALGCLTSFAAVSLVIVFTSEGFATTIFAGVTALVSSGILVAGVAAAIYAKPTWDDFRKQLPPFEAHVEDFSLKSGDGTPLATETPIELDALSRQAYAMVPEQFSPPVFVALARDDLVIRFRVAIVNDDRERELPLNFNLLVPEAWALSTNQESHYVSGEPIPYGLGGAEVETMYTTAKRIANAEAKVMFHAEIRPRFDTASVLNCRWPMAFRVGLGPRTIAIRHDWILEVRAEDA